MNWFNIVADIAGIIGAVLSAITLFLTKSTRAQLRNYKFQVDIKEQLNILKGSVDTTLDSPEMWDRRQIISCQQAADRIRILYSDKISDDLSTSLQSFTNKLMLLKREPDNGLLMDEICNDLITLNTTLEKELTKDAV